MMKNVHSFAEVQETFSSKYLRLLTKMAGGRQLGTLLFVGLLLGLGGLHSGTAAAIDPASVQRAIDRGVTYLRSSQNERGGWNEYGSQSCGLSSLCTLALLNAGVSRDDPDMVRAMRYLRLFEPEETYSVALQTLVYCQLGAAGDLDRIRRNVRWLIDSQRNQGVPANRVGSWSYGRGMGNGDPSNAQFAVLALGAAKDRGIEIEAEVFQRAIAYWQTIQRSDGGWGYGSSQPATGSMTCAGIASMIIGRDGTAGGSSKIAGDKIQCCGSESAEKDPVEAGLKWLGDRFTTEVNPGGDSMTFFYYLYALERVGRLSGRRFIGGHDWYREGAEQLLAVHDQFQGFWSGAAPMESNRDIATSFALLFLSKGKRQVVVGQLQYDSQPSNQWRSHPEGVKHLVRHVERDWGRDLTWQTIIGQPDKQSVATVEDLLQTPVLMIRGKNALNFSEPLVKNLGEYIEQGGTILFEADGGDGCGDASAFEASVRELCATWFEGAPLDRLPPSHPVWFAQHEVDPAAIPLIGDDFWVYGVQACCRTAVFYVPNSLSCRWELSDVLLSRREVSESARKQIDLAIRLGENVIAYATGRELKDKLDKRVVLDASDAPQPTRGTIEIAMLSLDAGGEEARRAIPNAADLIRQRIPIEIIAADQPIRIEAKGLNSVPVLWLHGRTEFELTADQRKGLAEFIQNGGFVVGTAICGNEAFAKSFRHQLSLLLPDSPLQTMPSSHRALTDAFGGFDITSVTIRKPTDRGAGQVIDRRTGAPVIEFATVDNMANVFFSPLDISCALESQNSVQCPGYPTEDAAKIVANLILFALNQ
ncbi:hypothetical protein Pla52o_27170 [Novipirellula galeiformis]|uniref:DUF4159 domain-containing protein n=1 Tax=Novipirellula galeiformis TaxID=2528004 RepID=A0A5C6CG71_9BACT|nr:DUF4159 domain-containing protein [Novipirellula galeiformis]TWU23182.1 hypothetical protein Pla52o_27170 [Novipirellula galeiformis]